MAFCDLRAAGTSAFDHPIADVRPRTHSAVMTNDLAGRIIRHYEKHALAWDRDRQSSARNGIWNDKGWHDRFIGSLTKASTVLDLGCGSGRP